jgi:hypothetical protein
VPPASPRRSVRTDAVSLRGRGGAVAISVLSVLR